MELCVPFLRRLFLIAVVSGLHVSGVAINVGNEIIYFSDCGGSGPVFVNLSCTFTYSTVTSSSFITTKWTDITDPSNPIIVVTVNNDGSLSHGPQYQSATIRRLNKDRLDGSIELELISSLNLKQRIFDSEVTVSGDSPALTTRPVIAINTSINTDPCPDTTTAVTCTTYSTNPCETTTPEPNCSCETTTPDPHYVIITPQPEVPGVSIGLALAGLILAGIVMYSLIKTNKVDETLKKVAWVLLGLGLALCVAAIVLSVLYITDTPAHELKYSGFDVGGAVCSFVELGCFLGGLIVFLLSKSEAFGSSLGDRLEMGDGIQPAIHCPKRPPSDISRKDVNVDVKQTGGQGRGLPRKNSVEPQEKKATAPTAVRAPAPRKLPPMPQVDVNTEVRALKKKKKKKPAAENTE